MSPWLAAGCVTQHAREVVAAKLNDDPEWKAQIDGLLVDTLRTFTETHRAKSAEKLAEHLARLVTGERF